MGTRQTARSRAALKVIDLPRLPLSGSAGHTHVSRTRVRCPGDKELRATEPRLCALTPARQPAPSAPAERSLTSYRFVRAQLLLRLVNRLCFPLGRLYR